MTITESLRRMFKKELIFISKILLKIGFSPNSISVIGFLGTAAAAFLISRSFYFYGGLFAGLMGVLDAVDGTMARLLGEPGKLGSLFDSLIDRYSESILLLGFLVNFTSAQCSFGIIMVYIALCGSFFVSYIRARSEGLGLEVKIGILTRVERLVILVFSLVIGYPIIGVILIAIFSNITALQRFFYARSVFKDGS